MKKLKLCLLLCFLFSNIYLFCDNLNLNGKWFLSTQMEGRELLFENADIFEFQDGQWYQVGHIEIESKRLTVYIGEDVYFAAWHDIEKIEGVGIAIRYKKVMIRRQNDITFDIDRVKVATLFTLERMQPK